MNKRFIKIIILIAFVILIAITLYRFINHLGASYQQMGMTKEKEPVNVNTTGSLS